jgi:hypothetical protein
MKGLPPATRRCPELVEGSKGWSFFVSPQVLLVQEVVMIYKVL